MFPFGNQDVNILTCIVWLAVSWQCKYTYFKPLDRCVEDKHEYHWHDALKRFFKCPCGQRAIALDRMPHKHCRSLSLWLTGSSSFDFKIHIERSLFRILQQLWPFQMGAGWHDKGTWFICLALKNSFENLCFKFFNAPLQHPPRKSLARRLEENYFYPEERSSPNFLTAWSDYHSGRMSVALW